MSWLPPPRRASPRNLRPWLAPSVSKRVGNVSSLTYIVAEEIMGDVVGLSLSKWPGADPQGRLRFDVRRDPIHVAVSAKALCTFLRQRGLSFRPADEIGPSRARPLGVGTAFAAEVRKDNSVEWTPPMDRWIPGPVYDITADAREVAKLAYHAAVTEPWKQQKAEKLGLTKGS
jgi:hypothetical protein